jgi:asparagine synthase (glutamine-hydrolysing)
MVADVPVGAFLSGGLDSSTIVALMQTRATGAVKTFSVGFGEMINELPYAKQVADQYRTEHYEIDLELPPLGELFERVAMAYDEPFGDSSSIPTYLISQFARREVKAVLSGDGGDELFGGYAWYLPLVGSMQTPFQENRSLIRWLFKWIRSKRDGGSDIWKKHVTSRMYFSEAERRRIWGHRQRSVDTFRPGTYYFPDPGVSGLNQAFHFDLTSYLPGDILVKVDRAAMANSLETRAPFLDRDLVEFMLTLPAHTKVTAYDSKILMRHALSDLWPSGIRKRPKQGFGVPFSVWLRHPDLQRLFVRIFSKESRLKGLLPGLPTNPTSPDSYQSWLLLTLGVWLDNHCEAAA